MANTATQLDVRPKCKATRDDNMFYIMGCAYTQLLEEGKALQATTMLKQVERSEGMGEALRIINLYVEII